MKKLSKHILILISALFVWIGLTATVFGQATSITKEEFDKETDKALKTAEVTFPRREKYSNPNKRDNFEEGKKEPSYTTLNETNIQEFLAKDRIRYEFITTFTDEKTVTKRIQIGSICYNLNDGRKWNTTEISCDQRAYSISVPPAKVEYFVENGTLDSKPVKIFRTVQTGRVYSDGKPPYINEYLYYLDSAGRLLKREYLTRRGEEKSKLENSTTYEYDVKIAPINPPSAQKTTKKRG